MYLLTQPRVYMNLDISTLAEFYQCGTMLRWYILALVADAENLSGHRL